MTDETTEEYFRLRCPRCKGEAAQEGVYGPEGCQGDPDDYGQMMRDKLHAAIMENEDRVNAPEPLGEPANIRTELALLKHRLDILEREVEIRLTDIDNHIDWSRKPKSPNA